MPASRKRNSGYTLSGWNTKTDGSDAAYSVGNRFYCDTETQNADDNWDMAWDEAAMAQMPDAPHTQWEKASSAKIPVPSDMREQEDAVIYVAVYNADGSFAGVQTVSADEEPCLLYDTENGMTYQFFCTANDGSALPLTATESGTF